MDQADSGRSPTRRDRPLDVDAIRLADGRSADRSRRRDRRGYGRGFPLPAARSVSTPTTASGWARSLVTCWRDAILGGSLDSRSAGISDFITLVGRARSLTPTQVFTFVYLTLSTAIDELSLDPRLGANTEPWPQVAQIVRRAAFDVLARGRRAASTRRRARAITDRADDAAHAAACSTRCCSKECHRAERFEHWLSMMLIDIDNLSEINRAHGYGVGDRILERMGILMRTYFRQHDWVARYSEDTIAVLLPETSPADALTLAERTRTMVDERLTFRDYRTEQRAAVTVSVAVASARALEGEPIDADRFLTETEAALERAKTAGRNRVEHVEMPPRLMSIDEAAEALGTDLEGIERLVGDGKLEPINAGRHVRLERDVVARLAAQAH